MGCTIAVCSREIENSIATIRNYEQKLLIRNRFMEDKASDYIRAPRWDCLRSRDIYSEA
jgi:hypothetical protein